MDAQQRPAALRRAGLASWSLLGIIALIVVVAAALSAISGILIPLIIAVIVGLVLEPLAQKLQRVGVPATLATVMTLLLAVAVAAAVIAVVVAGFIDQWPEIYRQLLIGWHSFVNWAADLDVDGRILEQGRFAFESHAAQLGQGALGAVTSTFYGVISLIMGTFFAVFFLFFVLRDGSRFAAWLATTTGLDATEVETVTELSRQSIRGYFRGTAITALLTAPIFMIPLLILGVPLAIPIFVLYFFMSFIPYLGAWLTGAFVVLIAFGSGGPTAALVLGITFIVSNGTIQSAVASWALGSSLQLHPMSVLLATMVGGTAAGLIGMVLGPPVLAIVLKSFAAIRHHRSPSGGTPDTGPSEPAGQLSAE
ncbi:MULTISPECIES: AI-2E family transporter [unclassified Gordonia (in: high G+C Gram-positive bacteria)]